jgi:hypothetical protein
MITVRLIGLDDYSVHEDGQRIGRIRLAHERAPPIWVWTVTVTLPGAPLGDAQTLDEAKGRFKVVWEAFKQKHGPEELAKAFAKIGWANRPDRYDR